MSRLILCNVCTSKNTSLIYQPTKPLSITSDLRVWEAPVKVFQCKRCGHIFKDPKGIKKEIDKIYKSYQLFEDEDEQDQAIFIQGVPKSRSRIIVEIISSHANLAPKGNFLDIGCNKGLLLREFSKGFPNWSLFGYEISDHYEKYIKKIPGFGGFYNGSITKIAKEKQKFDLITMIHSLEHIDNPLKFLKKVHQLLNPDGLLFVQVPNYYLNAFDILVFEHFSHFSQETLEQVLINSGFRVVIKNQQIISKELIFIGRKADGDYSGELKFTNFLSKVAKQNIQFLKNFAKFITRVKSKERLLVFGTAEVGTWVSGLLGGKFDFFLDESPWRIGKKHLGFLIKHPKVIKKGDNVILAMAPVLAKIVYEKWKHTKANFLYPFN